MNKEQFREWLTHPLTEAVLKEIREYWEYMREAHQDYYWCNPEKSQTPDMMQAAVRIRTAFDVLQQIEDGDFADEE